MAPTLVGVKIVTGATVQRDWALHFCPKDGSLESFFRDVASGSNDSGDGFVLAENLLDARVRAYVSEHRDGTAMSIPLSASFTDALSFGTWLTFNVSEEGGGVPRTVVSNKPEAAVEREVPRLPSDSVHSLSPAQSEIQTSVSSSPNTTPPCQIQRLPLDTASQKELTTIHEIYMELMQKLLQAMPNNPVAEGHDNPPRCVSCITSEDVMSELEERGVSSEVVEALNTPRSSLAEDTGTWTNNISQLVFEYISTVMFTEEILLEVNYKSWEGVLAVIENNSIACDVALQQLSRHVEKAAKCLMSEENNSECKEFAHKFMKAVVKHAYATHQLVSEGDKLMNSPLYRLGNGLLDLYEVKGRATCDVVRLFDVICSCVLVTLQLKENSMWSRAIRLLCDTSAQLSKTVWSERPHGLGKLENVNKMFVRLLRNGLDLSREEGKPAYVIGDEFREVFSQYPMLAKGFLHPALLVNDEFVEFLQAYMWKYETAAFQIMKGLEELMIDEEVLSTHDFLPLERSMLRILLTPDGFESHRIIYWVFRPREVKSGIWHLAFGRLSRPHRWRFLRLLMSLSRYEDESVENSFQNAENWSRLVSWMAKDGAKEGGMVGNEDTFEKQEIFEWADRRMQ